MRIRRLKSFSYPTPAASSPLIVEESLLREPNLWVPGRKPVGPMKIDWSHPMTDRLQAAFIFSPWNGITGGKTLDMTGHGHDIIWVNTPTVGPYINTTSAMSSYGLKSNTAGTHYGYIAAGNIPAAGKGVYAMAWAGVGETTSSAIFTIYGPTGGPTDLQAWSGSATYQFQPYNCADVPNETQLYTSNILDRHIRTAYWNDTVNSQQGVYSMHDGVPQTLTDTLTSDPLPTSSRKLLFLTDADTLGTDGDGSLGNWYQGLLEYWYCWDRKLTEAEGHSINQDPYQFMVPA